MSEELVFDFSGFDDEGFDLVPPGRYEVETLDWKYRKKDTGVRVLYVPLEIKKGDYAGVQLMYFHSIQDSRNGTRYLLQFLRRLGILSQDDKKGEKGTVSGKLVISDEADDRGYRVVEAVDVNGEKRPPSGRTAIAVVTHTTRDGSTQHWVDRVESIEQGTDSDDPKADEGSPGSLPF